MITRSILNNKNFLKLWISEAASVIALCIINYVLLLRLFKETGSTVAISFLWIAYSLPALLIGPFAATIVDLIDRKTLLIITNLFQAIIILLFLPIKTRFFFAYGVVFLYSLLNQFYLPAESASLPALVPKRDLPQANGFFLFTKQAGTLLGFGIAGFFNKYLGLHLSLILCSSLLFIAFLSVITLPALRPTAKPIDLESSIAGFFNQVAEGYKFIKDHNSILFPLGLIAGVEITYTILTINIPALAQEIFFIPLEDAVILVIIPAILGAVAGVYAVPRLLKRQVRKKLIVQRSLLALGSGLLFTTTLLGYLPLHLRTLAIPLVSLLFGASFIGIEIPAQTFLQQATPNQMLGRIFGNLWFIITIATIVPLIFSASVTEFAGARFLLSAITIGTLAAWLYIKKFSNGVIFQNSRPSQTKDT